MGAENPGLEAYVELKTNKVIDSDRADAVFHKKLLKHWAQSYLLGVPVSSDCPPHLFRALQDSEGLILRR